MDRVEGSSTMLFPVVDGEVEILGAAIDSEHPLSRIDPHSLDLPGPNWVYSKMSNTSLMIYEVTMPVGLGSPRIRKHINVNLSNGACTSWVMDRKISDVNALIKSDVERCVEELDMLTVCSGGPPVSRFPIIRHSNARVDIYDNWRQNSCAIITPGNTPRCSACEDLQFELSCANSARKKSVGEKPKRVIINNLSHRKQSQIIFFRKRRQAWYRKKKHAEKEMMKIDDMIAQVSEEPEDETFFDDYENDNEDDA